MSLRVLSSKDDPLPSCYNRADYDRRWRPGCPHWYQGGNAHETPALLDRHGVVRPWTQCEGCRQRTIVLEQE